MGDDGSKTDMSIAESVLFVCFAVNLESTNRGVSACVCRCDDRFENKSFFFWGGRIGDGCKEHAAIYTATICLGEWWVCGRFRAYVSTLVFCRLASFTS